jgi:hypothetical protein
MDQGITMTLIFLFEGAALALIAMAVITIRADNRTIKLISARLASLDATVRGNGEAE